MTPGENTGAAVMLITEKTAERISRKLASVQAAGLMAGSFTISRNDVRVSLPAVHQGVQRSRIAHTISTISTSNDARSTRLSASG